MVSPDLIPALDGIFVAERFNGLENVVALSSLLGYLNYSTGRPDIRFQKNWNDAWTWLVQQGEIAPWLRLPALLKQALLKLHEEGSSAFQDVQQADQVLCLLTDYFLSAYRSHHKDLLGHRLDVELFQPFFVVRALEAILAQGSPWTERDRIVRGALRQLNDFVGYRPIPVLENRPKGEVYDHERHRPVPIYIQGAGVSHGPFQKIVEVTFRILRETEPLLLDEAYLDLEQMEEWAIDMRAYDHLHPVNRRPNYLFGEWDPHCLNNQGNYTRFISRQVIFQALADRLQNGMKDLYEERLFEAAAVLAGTVLMASSIAGRGPGTFDSSVSLGSIVPRIARLRDEFYKQLMARQSSARLERLREEEAKYRQPFGAARQHLNHFMANARAFQLQQRRLMLLYASLGAPVTSMELGIAFHSPAARFQTELQSHLTLANHEIDRGDLQAAAERLPACEQLLHRGIACGAIVDPWSILGFQAQFPLFQTVEDSVHDQRIDELVQFMEMFFAVQARLLSEAAAVGQTKLVHQIIPQLQQRAEWWDQYAAYEVSGIVRVRGSEHLQSAQQVSLALDRWHQRGETAADLAFWREQVADFEDAKSFALVVDALLRKHDYQAAMGLLMTWLSRAEDVPLEEGDFSFHALVLRWLITLLFDHRSQQGTEWPWPLIKRFFAQLEVNAEEYWQVPSLFEFGPPAGEPESKDLFAAAYEDVTYRDSTDDGEESSLVEGGPKPAYDDFPLEDENDQLSSRLRFLATVARLWQIIARQKDRIPYNDDNLFIMRGWLTTALQRREQLKRFMDELRQYHIPIPAGHYDSLVEYDRRRQLLERAIEGTLAASLDLALAIRVLQGLLDASEKTATDAGDQPWSPVIVQIEQAMIQSDINRVRSLLPVFIKHFEKESLLYSPLEAGGNPHTILQVRTAQITLRELLESLPRLGLLRQTYQLVRLARDMEQHRPAPGRQITEFNHLFQNAFQSIVETVVESIRSWDNADDPKQLVQMLESLTRPFMLLWVEHSQTVRLSSMESISSDESWQALEKFIKAYGAEWFTPKFMTLGNLRGIIARGMDAYLTYLEEDPEATPPPNFMAALQSGTISRPVVIQQLTVILKVIVENYEEYKDYNSTTTQSDYGDNLFRLLAFLRLKTSYDRHAWNFKPLIWAHDVLCRKNRQDAAELLRREFGRLTKDLARKHLEELKRLQQAHGMTLRTIADYLEEGFVKPLEYDRLRAMAEPVLDEMQKQHKPGPAFDAFRKAIAPFAAKTSGIGLDVPTWLKEIENEVQRLREARSTLAGYVEKLFWIPRVQLKRAELEKQFVEWERPLDADSALPQ